MFAKIFIDRPIFASVCSIVITVAGLVAVFALPVAQYPEITPPTVQVTCIYPGANAQVVADTVAAPIEQQVNGVEKMLYMSSQCTNDGTYNLTVTFELGTNLDIAQVLVQNRVAIATPSLPEVVKATGVTTKKKSPNIMLVVNLISPDNRYDQLYLSNYATIQVRDELSRITGVGDVAYLGQQDYSMRIWLDPEKLATRNLTASDVVNSLREQNVQVAAGAIGQQPAPTGQDFQFTMSTLGRLIDPEQFAAIVVKTGKSGQTTLLRDVARVELGAKSQDQSATLDGKPSVGLAIFQLPGSNALATAEAIRAKMEELKERFPKGLEYQIVYDTTPFINESIHEVFKALLEAVILVAIVVLVFLQNWRATLIPLIAVPVSIIGTFAVLKLFGFSLNNLTLFGLVLAIGIVVDDAIVVVEAVEHNIEHGMSPYDATVRAMEQVSGPVIAIALVLCAVFVPCAFISGITGQFFRQFAITIAVSTIISAFNSLTLSPALSAILLKPKKQTRDPLTLVLNFLLGWFFKLFNKSFDVAIAGYAGVVRWSIRLAVIVLVIYGGLIYLTYVGFTRVPVGFIPNQDKGYLLLNMQLPDAASVQRTRQVLARIEQLALATPGVKHTVGTSGMSFLLNANASNFGSIFVILEDFEHRRHEPELYADKVAARLRAELYRQVPEAQIAVFGAPPVDGLGSAGGFKFMVQDRGNAGLGQLQQQTDNLVEKLAATNRVVGMFSSFRANIPQLFVDIDREKVKTMGVSLGDLFNTLQVYLGGFYTNDFNQFGRTWQVNLQADQAFRMRPEDVGLLKVRNATGEMVPLGTVAEVKEIAGPLIVQRYNTYTAAPVNGAQAPGFSSGQAINLVAEVAKQELPSTMSYEWTELTLMQILAGNTAVYVFAGAVLLVFLVLAAQYESWTLPMAVILVVPMCLLCSIVGVVMARLDMNIFTQIGFVVLVGLASKNAILIVEFAKDQEEKEGKDTLDATITACRLRLRPILMTSFAFILGVVPLMLATGAGAEMRSTLGIAVFSGMLGVTVFGIFLTPVFYYALRWLTGFSSLAKKGSSPTPTEPHTSAAPPHAA